MGLQYSVSVNNARLDAIETAVGTSPKLRGYTGSMPANCAAAATGTLLFEMALPSDWMAAASAGVKSKAGVWTDTADANGVVGYCRIVDTAGTVTGIQGEAGIGTGVFQFINTNIATGQSVTCDTFSLTAANT
jgi:hypothetical protein